MALEALVGQSTQPAVEVESKFVPHGFMDRFERYSEEQEEPSVSYSDPDQQYIDELMTSIDRGELG